MIHSCQQECVLFDDKNAASQTEREKGTNFDLFNFHLLTIVFNWETTHAAAAALPTPANLDCMHNPF